jgi:hypothetical protein
MLAGYARELEIVVSAQMRALGWSRSTGVMRGCCATTSAGPDEWGDWKMTAREGTDLGDARVVMVGRVGGQGGESGAATDSDFGAYQSFSRGLIRHEQFCFDRDEAFRAAGLSDLSLKD